MKVRLNNGVQYSLKSANESFSVNDVGAAYYLMLDLATQDSLDDVAKAFGEADALTNITILSTTDAVFSTTKYLTLVSVTNVINEEPYVKVLLERAVQ